MPRPASSFDGVATLTFNSTFSGNFNFSLPTFNDGLIEGDETFTVALTPSSATTTATNASVGIGAANSVDTTITDNDTLTISLTGSGTVPESTAASYTVNLSNPIDPDATVSVGIEFHFGGTESDDFNQQFLAAVQAAADAQAGVSFDGVATLTLDSAFSGNFNFSLPTFNDGLIEGDETFTVALTPSSATTTATNASVGIGAANSVDTTITDNDTLNISLTGSGTVPETTPLLHRQSLQPDRSRRHRQRRHRVPFRRHRERRFHQQFLAAVQAAATQAGSALTASRR